MITQRFRVNHLSWKLYCIAGEIHHILQTDRKQFGSRNNVAESRSAMTSGHERVEIIYCPTEALLSSLVFR